MSLRSCRPEILLLAALALTWLVQGLGASHSPLSGGRQSAVWEEQEQRTRSEIRHALGSDRKNVEERMRRDPALRRRFQALMLGLALLAVGVLFQWGRWLSRRFTGAGPERRLGSPSPPAWGFRQVFRIALGIWLAIQGSMLVQGLLFGWVQPSWLDRRVGALIDTLLADLIAGGAAAWFLFRRGRRPPQEAAPVPSAVRAGFRAYLMSIPLFILLLLAISWALSLFHIEPPPQPIFTLYLSEERTAVVRVLLLLAVVTGPVAEELFFRGFLYGWLRQRIGVARGLLLTAFLFAALHMDPVAFLPILGLGLLFGWVYERTGSLAAPIAIHIFHNGGMLFLASVIKALVGSP